MDPLDDHGLSPAARETLDPEVQERVAEAWSRGRALILNANKPGYSEAFTVQKEQYALVREALYQALEELADERGELTLKRATAFVQATVGTHPRFPKGRMTNYTRYIKTDLEVRGELARVPRSSPQRIRWA